MQRLMAVVLAGTLLAACGGGDDEEGNARTVDPPTTTEAAETTTTVEDNGEPVDLTQIVVRLEDLPTGWTATEPEPDDDTEDCAGEDLTDDLDPADRAEVAFQQSDFGPFVGSLVGRFADDDEAGDVIDAFADAMAACDGYVQTEDDGSETTYSVTQLSFPNLGDETFAARVSGTTAFGPLNVDLVVARQGPIVMMLTNGGLGAADSELTEKLLRLMVDRAA